MTIEFTNVPDSIRKPGTYTEEDTSNALRGLVSVPTSVLFIGQRISLGTVAALVPTRVYDSETGKGYFGHGSMLAKMISAGFQANPNMELTAMAVDDAAGVLAAGAIKFTGTATAAGVLTVYIGNMAIEVPIANSQTAITTATALVAAMTTVLMPDLPVTAAVNNPDTTQADLTAKNKGTMGNDIPIAVTITAPGITAAITPMASGATDPDLTTALTTVYGTQYHLICCGINAAAVLQKVRDHLTTLAGPLEQRPGLGVYGHRGSLADATTLAGTSLNSGRMTGALLRATRSLAYEIGAAYAGVIAAEDDPAAPLNGRILAGLAVPALSSHLSRSEQETALLNGVTPLEVATGDRIRIVRAVSTYVTNGSGTPDETLLDITTLRTLDDFRYKWRARVEVVFGPDAPASNRKLLTKNLEKIRAETIGVMVALERLERLRNVSTYKDDVLVEESITSVGRVNVSIPAPVVPGLHVLAAKFNLVL